MRVRLSALSDTMQRVESERVAAQAGALGETGLKDCGRTLEEAEATNMVAAPHSVFKDFPVPDIDRVRLVLTCPTIHLFDSVSRFLRYRLRLSTISPLMGAVA